MILMEVDFLRVFETFTNENITVISITSNSTIIQYKYYEVQLKTDSVTRVCGRKLVKNSKPANQ